MSQEKLTFEVEKAKLRAMYWNGLAIATIAVGALPIVLRVADPMADVPDDPWLTILVYGSAIFLTVSLSRFFHILALRAVHKASE